MREDWVIVALSAGAVVLGALCIGLFVLALRRVLGRHEEVVTTMLQRYDDRLVEFAQTLSDALNQTLPARIAAAISGATGVPASPASPELPDHTSVMRMLEVARERTDADAAVAVVSTPSREPLLATVGLSEAEAARVGGIGVPDYRGARAIQVAFSSEGAGAQGRPIRAGLAVPLLDSPTDPGMLAVLTREPDRRFSELDITTLEDVLSLGRPQLETSFELREADPVPERDPVTSLYDRPAFHALLEREIARAQRRGEAFALLMLDVDRLTSINAKIGHLAADDVLALVGSTLTDAAGPHQLPCRVSGGRFAVLVGQGDSREAEALYERIRALLAQRPFPSIGVVTLSGGIAELLAADDAAALIVRADAALSLAKGSGRDLVVTAAKR